MFDPVYRWEFIDAKLCCAILHRPLPILICDKKPLWRLQNTSYPHNFFFLKYAGSRLAEQKKTTRFSHCKPDPVHEKIVFASMFAIYLKNRTKTHFTCLIWIKVTDNITMPVFFNFKIFVIQIENLNTRNTLIWYFTWLWVQKINMSSMTM